MYVKTLLQSLNRLLKTASQDITYDIKPLTMLSINYKFNFFLLIYSLMKREGFAAKHEDNKLFTNDTRDYSRNRISGFSTQEIVIQNRTNQIHAAKNRADEHNVYRLLHMRNDSSNFQPIQKVRMANQKRLLSNVQQQTENVSIHERRKRQSDNEDELNKIIILVNESTDYNSTTFRRNLENKLKELIVDAISYSMNISTSDTIPLNKNTTNYNNNNDSNEENNTSTTENVENSTTTGMLPTTEARNNSSVDNSTKDLNITEGTTLSILKRIESGDLNIANITVIIAEITEVTQSARKKRQAAKRAVEVSYMVLNDEEVLPASQVAFLVDELPVERRERILGYQLQDEPIIEVEDTTEETTEMSMPEKAGLEACWVAAIVLGILLGICFFSFLCYLIYESEMEKKQRKKEQKEKENVDLKLMTEKDRLLKENGELRRQVKQLEGLMHHEMSLEQSNQILARKGKSSTANHLSLPAQHYRTPTQQPSRSKEGDFLDKEIIYASNRQTSSQMKGHTPTPTSRSIAPPPGTGQPGHLFTDADRKKLHNLKSEAAFAMPDGFKPKSSPKSIQKPRRSKSLVPMRSSEIDLHLLDSNRSTGNNHLKGINTAEKSVNTDRVDFTEKNVIDALFAQPLRDRMSRAAQKKFDALNKGDTTPDTINLLQKPMVDAQTQTEFEKQDEKLIRYYKKVIRRYQKQLEQTKPTHNVNLKPLAASGEQQDLNETASPSTEDIVTPHPPPLKMEPDAVAQRKPVMSSKRLKAPIRTENEEKFAVAATNFLQEIAPILDGMDFRVVRTKGGTSSHATLDSKELKELAKYLYGDIEEPQPEVINMFQKGFSTSTVSRIKDISPLKTHQLVMDEYIRKGSIDIDKLTKELEANTEQVVAVRNFIKNHKPSSNEEILQHMPRSLHINPQVVKLSLAMIYRGYI